MKKSGLWKMVCVVCVFCAASVIASPAQTLTTIYNFAGANGSHPYAGLLLAGDGNFYGTTVQGGPHGAGSVFKITPSGTLTTLHSFNGSDGLNPYAGLVLGNDGNFYGTTNNGGYHSIGEVFKITPGGTVTTLPGAAGNQGTIDGAGSVARFYQPSGIAVDDLKNVFVADTLNQTIREISAAGVVTTIAGAARSEGVRLGPLPGSLNHPGGIALLTGLGTSLIVADTVENSILLVTLP